MSVRLSRIVSNPDNLIIYTMHAVRRASFALAFPEAFEPLPPPLGTSRRRRTPALPPQLPHEFPNHRRTEGKSKSQFLPLTPHRTFRMLSSLRSCAILLRDVYL